MYFSLIFQNDAIYLRSVVSIDPAVCQVSVNIQRWITYCNIPAFEEEPVQQESQSKLVIHFENDFLKTIQA
jgi:hypothetical protein